MLVTVLMGTLFSRVLPLAFTHLGFNCSSWKDLVDSTEGSLNPWAGTIVEIQHNDCYHVGPFSCQATTHNSRMLTLNPHRVESGVIYSIYVVLDVVFPDVRMLHFRRFLTSSSYLSTGTAALGCGPCPSCGTSFYASAVYRLILMYCFQGIVPTLIIVQIGLGMSTHDADTSASVVRTDGRAMANTTEFQYDIPPSGSPPPPSPIALPPVTFSMQAVQRTNQPYASHTDRGSDAECGYL